MNVKANLSVIGQTAWYQYVIRFILGGAITVVAGLIARKFGPSIGGLFLAFPAIFPAGATLIEKHQKKKKQRAGKEVGRRGQDAAALDAAGTAMGAIGLIVFALLVWIFLPGYPTAFVLAASTLAWLALSVTIWLLCEKI